MNHMVPLPSTAEASPTDAELRHHFPDGTLQMGRDYADRGRVLRLHVTPDGRRIEAETQGSRSTPYAQSIVLSRGADGRLRLSGLCSCPMRTNCKHVVAVLLEARGKHRLLPSLVPALAPAMQPAAAPRVVVPVPVPARPPPPVPGEPPLPDPLACWLRDMERAGKAETEDYPPNLRQRLLYVLDVQPVLQGAPRLLVQPMSVTLLKDGSLGVTAQHVSTRRGRERQTPAFLRPSDRLILSRLDSVTYDSPDPEAEDTLRRIIATGRARWHEFRGPIVQEAPARPAELVWEMGEDGSQHPVLTLAPPAIALCLPAPWFAEPATGLVGPLQLGLPAGVVTRLLHAPPVPVAHVERVRAELTRRVPNMALPAPQLPEPPEEIRAPMRPHLRLFAETMPVPDFGRMYGTSADPELLSRAHLSFGYGAFTVEAHDRRTIVARGRRLYHIARDAGAEADAMRQLKELGFVRPDDGMMGWRIRTVTSDLTLDSDDAWFDVMLHDVPRLRDAGWTIDIEASFPFRISEADGDWTAELTEGSGIDWLELHLGAMVDGQRVDLVPSLLRMIAGADQAEADLVEMLEGHDDAMPFLVPLADGRLLSVPLGRVRPILLALWELFTGGGLNPAEGARFTRLDAAGVAALEDVAGIVWQGGESLRALGRMLREAGDHIPNAVVPDSFHGTLRPYQAQGVDWLQFLRAAELGGILADDMGLGKTVQTLAHLLVEQASGRLTRPALIVCPTSLVPNWTLEAERFAPSLKLLALHGPARKERFGDIPAHDLVVTTYPLLTRDHDVLTQQDWHVVVLDEAQTIKNPNAETTRLALRLKAGQRLCLSGTPLQNHLGELWSLFDFLAPGFLGSASSFRTRFRTPIEKRGDPERQALLSRRVRPFLLRRTKEEVAVELPPKTEIVEPVEMESAQRGIYDAIRLAMHARVQQAIAEQGLARSGIIILDALLKMRQACCDPRLLKLRTVEKAKAGSAKLDRLMEMLTVMLAEGRRVLLFSQFTQMLALIEQRLEAAKIDYVMLTGDTGDRATPVRRFQAGEAPLFLISLKAGGVGLNLTAADTVIHYDPWWNPAVEDQATDRAHRIGQDKRVFVHRLVTLGTIEEKMAVLKERKRALVASVLEAERGGALRLTEADVADLFSAG